MKIIKSLHKIYKNDNASKFGANGRYLPKTDFSFWRKWVIPDENDHEIPLSAVKSLKRKNSKRFNRLKIRCRIIK